MAFKWDRLEKFPSNNLFAKWFAFLKKKVYSINISFIPPIDYVSDVFGQKTIIFCINSELFDVYVVSKNTLRHKQHIFRIFCFYFILRDYTHHLSLPKFWIRVWSTFRWLWLRRFSFDALSLLWRCLHQIQSVRILNFHHFF